ncbi:unnamed protein product [Cyclocybe aegerita]|uniref:Uncharacterized protein n=1 Tax=Cyclocybe aegerita TaxID=1973307 RepID=A0A8S0XQJ6_CYCAE|nr:unnamed protein product [Cyclocybe aegerita]
MATDNIRQLDRLHTRITKFMPGTPKKRCIGHVLHADPMASPRTNLMGSPSTGPSSSSTLKDAFDWGESRFQGEQGLVYIVHPSRQLVPQTIVSFIHDRTGPKIDREAYRNLMFPNYKDRAGYESASSRSSAACPRSRAKSVNPSSSMHVIKNGLTTDTTVGWVNGLKSLAIVRHYYIHYDLKLKFTALEANIVPYGGRDSGSVVLDRNGRIVALLTGGGGVTDDETDVTFGMNSNLSSSRRPCLAAAVSTTRFVQGPARRRCAQSRVAAAHPVQGHPHPDHTLLSLPTASESFEFAASSTAAASSHSRATAHPHPGPGSHEHHHGNLLYTHT